jgi:MoxR-like ATPase
MPNIRCKTCGLAMQVPAGGRRMCGCGAWLSGDEELPVVEPIAEPTAAQPWPRIDGDLSAIERLNDGYRRIRKEMSKAIVGQERVLEELLIAIFARGHCLLVGVPGLAKTLIIRTLADSLSLSFSRVQFTPDLMPSDIVGTNVIEEDHTTGKRVMVFVAGPIFANVLLADEINRTPPKTQAALLQAMQEREVTAGGKTYRLEPPFFVLATQNPIDQEGTYPLPEAQKDRFLMNTFIRYPQLAEEEAIVERTTTNQTADVKAMCDRDTLLKFQELIRSIPVSKHVTGYAVDLVRASRTEEAGVPVFIKEQVGWGAGPRASQALIHCAKCYAVLSGRVNVSCDDVRHLALPVLRHRIQASFAAEAEGITTDAIVKKLLGTIPERTHS